jgi:DNA repair protein RadC
MSLQDVLHTRERNRETGIPAVGAVPWGTHLCCFYDTKQDLIDILVPYFKAGLENNESCIWVTSEVIPEKEAEEAMRKAVPDFTRYLEKGQIEMIPYNEWYLKEGVFHKQSVLSAWIDKLNQALARGCEGMRVSGDVARLGEKDRGDLIDYEKRLNDVIAQYRMLVICSYSSRECRASETIDVLNNHQFALSRQAGDLVFTRSSERKQAEGSQEVSLPVLKGPLTPLQQRFASSGFEGFSDCEGFELLMSICPRGRQREMTKQCCEAFKNIRELLSASPHELEEAGLAPESMIYLKLLHDIPAEVLREKIIDCPVYESSKEIFDYLYYSMRDLKHEVFKVFYLNKRNQIIDVAELFEGTLDSISIRPREIVETAIQRNSSALIFVHNHITGDPTPSKSDKRLTRDLVFVGNVLHLRVLDHIIIGENRYSSFADEGLIQKYEDDFLNIRIRRIYSLLFPLMVYPSGDAVQLLPQL